MHDYDVGAVSLSVPPASAVLQQYRPAVLVKNNGVHDALAVGSLRIYDSATGLLTYTTEIYSGTIAPGETEPAQAVDYWTPPAIGHYQVIAYVTCINDQYEPNNSLPPVIINVTAAPPPPPPPVQAHAAQHEDGGLDEVNIDGLHGQTADAQIPLGHKASHQASGSDQLDVTGLPGILGQAQPIADHHTSHQYGGGDELHVDGLYGELYNLQKPKIHGNEKHDPNFALTPHGNEAHDPDFLKALTTPAQTGQIRELTQGVAKTLETIALPAGLLSPHDVIEFHASGYCTMLTPLASMEVLVYLQDDSPTTLGHFYWWPMYPTPDGFFDLKARLYVDNSGLKIIRSGRGITGPDQDTLHIIAIHAPYETPDFDVSLAHTLFLKASFSSPTPGDTMTIFTSSIRFVAGT